MIGKLKGVVDSLHEDHVILDVHGVGYVSLLHPHPAKIAAPRRGCGSGDRDTSARRRHPLFGFLSDSERDGSACCRMCRRRLESGARHSIHPASRRTLRAIALQDKVAVSRAPGRRPQIAARIVAELKDKAGAFSTVDPAAARLAGDDFLPGDSSAAQEAISALVNLGYARPQAATAIAASLKALGEAPKPPR